MDEAEFEPGVFWSTRRSSGNCGDSVGRRDSRVAVSTAPLVGLVASPDLASGAACAR
jgi:hypothetical protein